MRSKRPPPEDPDHSTSTRYVIVTARSTEKTRTPAKKSVAPKRASRRPERPRSEAPRKSTAPRPSTKPKKTTPPSRSGPPSARKISKLPGEPMGGGAIDVAIREKPEKKVHQRDRWTLEPGAAPRGDPARFLIALTRKKQSGILFVGKDHLLFLDAGAIVFADARGDERSFGTFLKAKSLLGDASSWPDALSLPAHELAERLAHESKVKPHVIGQALQEYVEHVAANALQVGAATCAFSKAPLPVDLPRYRVSLAKIILRAAEGLPATAFAAVVTAQHRIRLLRDEASIANELSLSGSPTRVLRTIAHADSVRAVLATTHAPKEAKALLYTLVVLGLAEAKKP